MSPCRLRVGATVFAAATLAATLAAMAAPAASADTLPGLRGTPVSTETGAKTSVALRMAGSTAYSSKVLTVTTQRQATPYYCAPASGKVALSALRSTLPTQRTIAGRMGTTTSGTYTSRIAPALNTFQSRNTYVTKTGLDLAGFRYRVKAGLTTYTAPNINPVQMARLPWYAGTGIQGGHAIVTYGYRTAPKHWDMHLYDPWDNRRHTYVRSSSIFYASIAKTIIW